MEVTKIEIDGRHYAVSSFEMEVSPDTETHMVPKDGYEMEHFPDKYGGVTVPVPAGTAREPQVLVTGKDVTGTIQLQENALDVFDAPWFRDAQEPHDVTVYIDGVPDLILRDCVFGIDDDELHVYATGYDTL